jgi:hypothetical protein
MTSSTKKIITLLDMLPTKEQEFVSEVVRKLIIAWDPDFTKLTAKEAAELKLAHEEIKRGETVSFDDINWG